MRFVANLLKEMRSNILSSSVINLMNKSNSEFLVFQSRFALQSTEGKIKKSLRE
jgi:hypothetical protein